MVRPPDGRSRAGWIIDPLEAFVEGQTTISCQPAYVGLRGHLLDERAAGFAADYGGLIRVSEVLQRASAIAGACRPAVIGRR